MHGKDITKEGSGNVGTLNTFVVSRSKKLAVITLIFDFLKGFLPVFILIYFIKLGAEEIFFSSCFIIIGHNFSIWLRFKGGRGLASSAGVFSLINYALLATWCFSWLLFYSIKRDVLFANVFATVFMPFVALIFNKYYIPEVHPAVTLNNYLYFIGFVLIIALLILYKHRITVSRFIPLSIENVKRIFY